MSQRASEFSSSFELMMRASSPSFAGDCHLAEWTADKVSERERVKVFEFVAESVGSSLSCCWSSCRPAVCVVEPWLSVVVGPWLIGWS